MSSHLLWDYLCPNSNTDASWVKNMKKHNSFPRQSFLMQQIELFVSSLELHM